MPQRLKAVARTSVVLNLVQAYGWLRLASFRLLKVSSVTFGYAFVSFSYTRSHKLQIRKLVTGEWVLLIFK